MDNSIIKNLSISLKSRIEQNKPIRIEQWKLYKEVILRILSENHSHLPQEYYSLKLLLDSLWQYQQFDKYSSQDSAAYGALWFGTALIETSEAQNNEELQMQKLVIDMKKYKRIFETINNYPGIMHKSLAQKCDLNVSRLSQIMSQLKEYRLFSYTNSGREKLYFLSAGGKRLLEAITPIRDKQYLPENVFEEYISFKKKSYDHSHLKDYESLIDYPKTAKLKSEKREDIYDIYANSARKEYKSYAK